MLTKPADDFRAATLQPSTLDLLVELDMTPRLLEQGLKSHIFQWRDLVEDIRLEFDYGLLAGKSEHPHVIQLEQHRTIYAALEVAERHPEFEMIRPARVLAVRQFDDRVEADVNMPDGREIVVSALQHALGTRSRPGSIKGGRETRKSSSRGNAATREQDSNEC